MKLSFHIDYKLLAVRQELNFTGPGNHFRTNEFV
jgi:hypothetical protein